MLEVRAGAARHDQRPHDGRYWRVGGFTALDDSTGSGCEMVLGHRKRFAVNCGAR